VGGLGSGGDGFAADPLEQGGAELTDLAADSGWVGGLELRCQGAGVDVVEWLGVGQEPLVGGLGDVIGLGDFGPGAGFGQQLLLWVNRLINGDRATQIWLSSATSLGVS
jgi:hypothetical protein